IRIGRSTVRLADRQEPELTFPAASQLQDPIGIRLAPDKYSSLQRDLLCLVCSLIAHLVQPVPVLTPQREVASIESAQQAHVLRVRTAEPLRGVTPVAEVWRTIQ